MTFATNYLSYFLLTNQLLPLLRSSTPARVVNVASKYGRTTIDFDLLQKLRAPYSYLRSTPQTMLARVLFTQELAARLEGTGVVANAVHPGLVANTRLLQRTPGARSSGSPTPSAARRSTAPTPSSGWRPRRRPARSPGSCTRGAWRSAHPVRVRTPSHVGGCGTRARRSPGRAELGAVTVRR